jgi:hypothetical protein
MYIRVNIRWFKFMGNTLVGVKELWHVVAVYIAHPDCAVEDLKFCLLCFVK